MQLRFSNSITLCLFFLFSLLGSNFALGTSSLSVHTDKSVYEYGDHLSLIFEVSNLTGDPITIKIIDDSGKSSSPFPVPISKLKSNTTSAAAFYKTSFKPGTYHIHAQYSGSDADTVFTLIDSGKIAIPPQYKILVKLWSEGQQPTDTNFANVIRDLIQYDIIQIPELQNKTNNSVHIPAWIKNDAKWWSEDLITDNDFGLGIQYLIKAKIMTV